MKEITIYLISLLLCTVTIIGCTDNQRAKSFGGTAIEKLPPNRKLVNITWKNDDMWLLTRPMTASDIAEKYEFKESSSFGVMSGTVIIEETKQ